MLLAELVCDALMQVIQRESWEHIKDGDIKEAATSFCGEIWQVPPMFSAIQVSFSLYFLRWQPRTLTHGKWSILLTEPKFTYLKTWGNKLLSKMIAARLGNPVYLAYIGVMVLACYCIEIIQ